jgi:hypothetical protein
MNPSTPATGAAPATIGLVTAEYGRYPEDYTVAAGKHAKYGAINSGEFMSGRRKLKITSL